MVYRKKDMPVVFIRMPLREKGLLKVEAEKKGMQLTTYCRMILLDSLTKKSN